MSVIHHTFGPHVTAGFAWRALGLLLEPWQWRNGNSLEALRSRLKSLLKGEACLFASGREALTAYLRSCDLEPGCEIIIQSFTCIALPNAIRAAGCSAVYVDIDPNTLNMDPSDVERKITIRTRAVICQHTFGIPADTSRLRGICDAYGLLLIEDCAHVIPDDRGPPIGIHADAIMLSFGRDKAISGIAGGAMVLRSKRALETLRGEEERAKKMPFWKIFRLLLYPVAYGISKPVYGFFDTGKALLWFMGNMGLLPKILTESEKRGVPDMKVRRMPNACAVLALRELARLREINDHRRSLTEYYLQECGSWKHPTAIDPSLPLQKFPLLWNEAERTRLLLKRENMYLDDGWAVCTVCPRDVIPESTGYVRDSCSRSEEIALQILSLPTHPTMTKKQAARLVEVLRKLET